VVVDDRPSRVWVRDGLEACVLALVVSMDKEKSEKTNTY
jgi:hypothetical protein